MVLKGCVSSMGLPEAGITHGGREKRVGGKRSIERFLSKLSGFMQKVAGHMGVHECLKSLRSLAGE